MIQRQLAAAGQNFHTDIQLSDCLQVTCVKLSTRQQFHNVLRIHIEVTNTTELPTLIEFPRNAASYIIAQRKGVQIQAKSKRVITKPS